MNKAGAVEQHIDRSELVGQGGDSLVIGDVEPARGDERLGERLGERGIAFKHYAKPTNTRPAPLPLQQQIATEVNLVIEGLSD